MTSLDKSEAAARVPTAIIISWCGAPAMLADRIRRMSKNAKARRNAGLLQN
jgi:hypothetical protein